ncbi:MAG: P-type conjugative transfer protein TrbL [Gemmatimonadaceae bacterium]|nr:P-type conjugative transfer protein TrbL [Gemmatimonadaceae bacterium]
MSGESVLQSRVYRRVALVACMAALVLIAVPAFAQSQNQQPVLDGIANQYRDAARVWRPRLVPVAQQLFMLLASIEFAVSGMVWTLRHDRLDDIAAKFLLKFTLVAFLLALITSFTFWIPPIVNGFAAAGERAIGTGGTVSPSAIIDIGRESSLSILNALDVGVMLSNPAMAIFGAMAALLVALAYTAIAAQLVLVLVESYVVLGGGVLFLGFAAFRGTAAFAENLIAYTFGIGIKIFLLYLIVGLGSQIARGWIPLIQSSSFFGPASPLLQIVGGSIIFAVLAVRVPNAVAARLSGNSSFGIAHALRAVG